MFVSFSFFFAWEWALSLFRCSLMMLLVIQGRWCLCFVIRLGIDWLINLVLMEEIPVRVYMEVSVISCIIVGGEKGVYTWVKSRIMSWFVAFIVACSWDTLLLLYCCSWSTWVMAFAVNGFHMFSVRGRGICWIWCKVSVWFFMWVVPGTCCLQEYQGSSMGLRYDPAQR